VDIVERNVSLTALDRADVGRVEPAALGKALLRPAAIVPERPNPLPEANTVRRFPFRRRARHGAVDGTKVQSMGLQTMSLVW
jgi:hypothetical protein